MDDKQGLADGGSRWREAAGPQCNTIRDKQFMNFEQMITPDVPKSGRLGPWIYYMRGNKQVRRPWVRPRDPRTPAQLRCRAAFGTAVKAWSECQGMTQEDQRAWIAVAEKIRSRPRLAQSGPLTGQQYFVAVNCARAQQSLGMLRRPPAEKAGGQKPLRNLAQPTTRFTSFLGRTITFLTVLPSRKGFTFSEPLATASSSA